jgi:hypothetical protein
MSKMNGGVTSTRGTAPFLKPTAELFSRLDIASASVQGVPNLLHVSAKLHFKQSSVLSSGIFHLLCLPGWTTDRYAIRFLSAYNRTTILSAVKYCRAKKNADTSVSAFCEVGGAMRYCLRFRR